MSGLRTAYALICVVSIKLMMTVLSYISKSWSYFVRSISLMTGVCLSCVQLFQGLYCEKLSIFLLSPLPYIFALYSLVYPVCTCLISIQHIKLLYNATRLTSKASCLNFVCFMLRGYSYLPDMFNLPQEFTVHFSLFWLFTYSSSLLFIK